MKMKTASKFWAPVLVLSLAVTLLTGCGKQPVPPESGGQTTDENQTESTFDVSDTSDISATSNTSDASDNKEQDEPDKTEPPSLEGGILVFSESQGKYYNYKSTNTRKCQAFTVSLDKIDPETGEVTHIRTFSTEETHSCSAHISTLGGSNTADMLRCFNADMTLLAATLTMENGAEHVGWVDENGKFTDVSAKITTESDFGALTKHSQPYFWGDYLYYRDSSNEPIQINRVPINNLTKDAIEIIVADSQGGNLVPLPDGTVDDTASPKEYYDSSMKYSLYSSLFGDWVSADTCVGSYKNGIYRYQLSKNNEKTEITPSVKDRRNWNPVASPTGDQVAFLSQLTTGNDQSISLFLVPIGGGDPVKVNTSYAFPTTPKFDTVNNISGIIDWR